ncbi:hypothetical protein CgunFtcFv8_012936 [Champsocephalus gunnari]|uniref:Uncharacterized protein n=1 Tax=Champsocephalus gunnari TaxID=52237 RepID=A0AAN8HYB2_CHAGU|nr:hypothetical protein CgunFtcFv8_012936 [Champsocephalus gunnari]
MEIEEPRADSRVSMISFLPGVQEQSSSGDSVIDIRKQKSVEEIIYQEVRRLTDPVLEDLPDQVNALLKGEGSKEVTCFIRSLFIPALFQMAWAC